MPAKAGAACGALLLLPLTSTGQDTITPASTDATVRVIGVYEAPPRATVSSDIATAPASVTVLTREQLDRTTVTTYGDIFRTVPGISVLEYGQGLIAYGVSMRGFDEGHGRNVAVSLDGMPLNVTGSQHTNGYMDLAQLIPELVDRMEVVRGPFSIYSGNHAVGGSMQLYTDASPRSSVNFSVDNFGRARIVPIYSIKAGPGNLLLAFDGTKGNGYSKQSDIERLNLFTRYEMPIANGLASLRFQAYDADADAPGYLDYDRLHAGTIGKREFLSKGIGDSKSQQNLVFNFRSVDTDGTSGFDSGWFFAAYANNDMRKRWTNFDLTTPLESSVPLNQERDHLHQFGADLRKTFTFNTASLPSQAVVGAQLNDESVDALHFATDANRHPTGSVDVDRRVRTTTESLFAQYQIQPFSRLKLTLGARYDRVDFDVRLHPNDATYIVVTGAGLSPSTSETLSQFSPKAGLSFALIESPAYRMELFANAARGFKSPYPFADFFANASTGGTSDLSLSSLRSTELGLAGRALGGKADWRASIWQTHQDREADRNLAGIFQDFKETKRTGFDIEGSILLTSNIRLFGFHSQVRARIENPVSPVADHIPNVPEHSTTLGLNAVTQFGVHRLDWTLSDTYVGPQSITPDDARRSESFNRYTARVSYTQTGWRGALAYLSLVGYDKQFDEYVVDFGGGFAGATVKPKLRVIAGIQIPLEFAK